MIADHNIQLGPLSNTSSAASVITFYMFCNVLEYFRNSRDFHEIRLWSQTYDNTWIHLNSPPPFYYVCSSVRVQLHNLVTFSGATSQRFGCGLAIAVNVYALESRLKQYIGITSNIVVIRRPSVALAADRSCFPKERFQHKRVYLYSARR